MDSLEKILQQHHETIAACIFEPMVQGASGMRVYPAKVLAKIALLCREYDVLTIDDEVAMGFGRTGTMFACEHANVIPDIMCVAKGLTGGYLPVAATITTDRIYEAFTGNFASGREFQHGHTFTGNPLASAAAVATLSILKEQNIPQSLAAKTVFFQEKLARFNQLDCVGDIRCIGMVGALELVTNRQTKTKLPAEERLPFLIAQKALEYGIIIRPLGDVLYFIPAYCITEKEITAMFDAAYKAITDVMYR
jgi:adenosylmethionine-8-amino-7-oxononanoate aminotransferase